MIHEDITLSGSFAISGSLILPRHASSDSATAATGSMYNDTTDNVAKIYTGTEWVVVGEQAISEGPPSIEYLVIAGAGGGGSYGGGGAGGYLSSSLSSIESGSSITVTVGGGGAGSGNSYTTEGSDGVDSSIASAGGTSFTTVTSIGGGGGGDNLDGANDGGSGGGGSDGPTDATGGSGTVGQGNDGGDGAFSDPHYMGGGGGGAGSAGGNGVATGTRTGGPGGDGLASTITGTSTTRAGGGGGVRYNTSGTWGDGGTGGGGDGGSWNAGTSAISSNTAGTENTGGGGGAGKPGGSGVAILAYDSGSINAVGGIVGDAGNGRKYHQFNSSGTFKVGSTSDFTIDTTNLTGWWDAADYSSRGDTTWTDKMGNYNLTKGGTPTLGNNTYYTFQANGEYYNTGLTVTNGAKAMVLWIKYTGAGGSGYSLTGWQQSGAYCYLGRQDSNGRYYYYIGNSTGGAAATSPTTNVWYMLTLTNDASGNWGFYENDGSTVIASGTGINMGSNGTSRFNIGSVSNSSNHRNHAQIGMCFYYTKKLSTSDIANLYNATKTNFV